MNARAVGTELPERVFKIDRAQLVRYAGASLDFNPIHWSDQAAVSSGLDEVIAHGMLSMALAARIVTDWIGDPGSVVELSVRFSAPVRVPPRGAAEVRGSGKVISADEGLTRVQVELKCGHRDVLKNALVTVVAKGPLHPT